MKKMILTFATHGLFAFSAQAETVKNTKKALVPTARVVKLVELVDKADIKVSVLVEDLGGSTDLSPTQRVHFTLYSKGEMFSTDASFDLGPVFYFKSAKRVSGGIYEIVVSGNLAEGQQEDQVLRVDAINAINAIKSVTCEDFDCDASTNFKSSIEVTRK